MRARPLEALLDVDAAAEVLGVKPNTVRDWIRTGRLSGVRLGARSIRVRASELTRWIDARSTQAGGSP